MENYTKKAVRGTSIIFINSLFATVFSYLLRLLLARRLSVEQFGLFYSVFTFLTFFLFFRSFGLGSAMVKFISEFNAKNQNDKLKTVITSSFIFQLLFTVIFMIVFFFCANWLSVNYFKNVAAAPILKFLTFYILFSMLFIFLSNLFIGFQKIRIYSFISPVKNLLILLITFIFINLGFEEFSPVIGYVFSALFLFLVFLLFGIKLFNYSKYKIKYFSKTTKNLFFFGLPVLLTSIGGSVIGQIDTIILTYFKTMYEVGIYNVVLPSANIFLFLTGSLSAVLFPMASELWAKKENKKLSEGLRLLYKYSFVILIPLIFSIIGFSGLFLKIFFGKEYMVGSFALQILLVGVVFYVVAQINTSILAGIGMPKVATKIIIFAAIFNLILNIILIPPFGIVGAAIATTISYILVFFLSTWKLKNYVKLKPPVYNWIKTFISGITFVLTIFFLKKIFFLNVWVELFLVIAIAMMLYVILIFLLKLVDINEIKKYLKLVLK
ncbi:MAG: flippase [Nanoarchaeota archaeon]|nr:flippase [Nanoarchaeota archaeon]